MMEIVPFQTHHFLQMEVQENQRIASFQSTPEYLAFVEQLPGSFTILKNQEPIACFGWLEIHPGRAQIWSALSSNAGPHMVFCTRVAKRMIGLIPHKRIEAEVDAEFDAGQRWMEMLGFIKETDKPLKAHAPNGGDNYIYAKVK